MKQFSENDIFKIKDENAFEKIALQIFNYQAINNIVYKNYLEHLRIIPKNIKNIYDIPFLPISFFKTQKVISGNFVPEIIFQSSGTTGVNRSCHYIKNTNIYKESFIKSFELFYGDIKNYCLLALLPSYLEREGSSLIYMIKFLIEKSQNKKSGFYLNNTDELLQKLKELEKSHQKTILFGVSFALISLAEKKRLTLKNTIVMETGGMKGMHKELTKEELHNLLKFKFGINCLHSEYSMTELLSQAYSKENGEFYTPPWMKILIRDINDPFSYIGKKQSGGINIIDLANIYSCSFIETEDIGRLNNNGSFEVLGRLDNSVKRGCNLLVL